MELKSEDILKIIYNKDKLTYELYNNQNEIIISLEESIVFKLFDFYFENKTAQNQIEELSFRALGRIAKLRNLSFNINAADPANEFEMVPAYLRRNIELTINNEAALKNFYSSVMIGVAKAQKNNPEQVVIYLPAEIVDIMEAEKLTNACGEFMESLEYELETENEPILGSFFQKLLFKIKEGKEATQKEITEDFAKGKKALELKYVELPTAEQTEKLANSAAKIVEILDKQDEGVVRLGSLIVLKKQVDGKSKIIVLQLNFELITLLDKNPQLLMNLQTMYELLTGEVKGVKYLDETGAETTVII